jgi:hypothetical protein
MARIMFIARPFIPPFLVESRKLTAESCVFAKTFRTLDFNYLRTIPWNSFETLAKRKYRYLRKN